MNARDLLADHYQDLTQDSGRVEWIDRWAPDHHTLMGPAIRIGMAYIRAVDMPCARDGIAVSRWRRVADVRPGEWLTQPEGSAAGPPDHVAPVVARWLSIEYMSPDEEED